MSALSRIFVAVVACGAPLLVACGPAAPDSDPGQSPSPTAPAPAETAELRSKLARDTSPQVADPDLRALVEGNSALAFSLYDRLRQDGGNFFYSPLSVSEALAMTWAGARDQTEAQMATALHYLLDQTKLHPAMNKLDLALQSRGSGAKGADGEGFRLRINYALWGQRGYLILQPFLDLLALNYGAGLRVLDFMKDPDASRDTINAYVEQQTEGKIKKLIEKLDPFTRLVLTNTIYFNAAWSKVFPEESTRDQPFRRLDGSTVTAPAMSISDSFAYADGGTWKAVELPYDGEELAMLVVVPEPGQFDATEDKLCSDGIGAVVGALQQTSIALTMPKWKVESKWKLKEQLKQMGMTDAFDESKANFSGINGGDEPLWIDQVIHQSFISVDEKGTEAAAATAVIMVGGASPAPIPPLVIDRPFIYVIRDLATGSILFAGRVMDPSA